MDLTAERLVDLAVELRPDDLSAGARHAVKRSTVDAIGCAYGAFHSEPVVALRRLAAVRSASQSATVIGTEIETSPEMAAFVNSSMIRYLDFSDDYFGGTGEFGPHPSDNLGGLLAAAEVAGLGGDAFTLAAVIAYEVSGHFVDKVSAHARNRSWDYPVLHAMATALAASRLLGLSRVETHHALSLAVVPNFALNRTRTGVLSNWKAFAGPYGSHSGLFAALLASEGITGPPDPIEGNGGLLNQLGFSFQLDPLLGSGAPFKVERTYFKVFPVRYTIQLPIAVAIGMRDRVPLDQVESVTVCMPRRFVLSRRDHAEYWDPQTRETADHSPPYLIGAALVDGAITERTFTPARFRDPALLELVNKIDVVEDPEYSRTYPAHFQARIEVRLTSGETVTAMEANNKGHPANPMTDQDIEAKFIAQSESLLGPQRCRRVLDQLWALDELPSVHGLFDALRIPERT